MSYNKSKKKASIIFITCLVALACYIFYRIKKQDFINYGLSSLVLKKTDRLYKVSFDSLWVNEVEGNLFIKNLSIRGDTARQLKMIETGDTNAQKIILDVYVPLLKVANFRTARALLSKQLECQLVTISDAKVSCYLFPNVAKRQDDQEQQKELYKQVLGNLKLIKADSVSLINSEVKAVDFYSKEVKFHTYNTFVGLTDVVIDSTANRDTTRTLFCKQINVNAPKVIVGNKSKLTEVSGASFDTRSKFVKLSKVEYDGTKNGSSFKTKIEGITLEGISWTGPVEASMLIIKNAVFQRGTLDLITTNNNSKKETSKPATPVLTGLIKSVRLKTLQLNSFTFSSRRWSSKDSPYIVRNNFFSVRNINIDSSTKLDETLINNADEIALSNKAISVISADKLYEYRLTGLKLNSLRKEVFIKEARIIPRLNEAEFTKKARVQVARFDVSFRNVSCAEVDFGKLVKGEFVANKISTANNSARVFTDLSFPKDTLSDHGPQEIFPHQMLFQLGLKVKIKKFTATRSYIEYKEKNAKTDSSGKVRFSNTSFTINNIANYNVKSGEKTRATFATTFLEKIPVTGTFTFYIDDWKKGKFYTSAVINKSFDATIFNQLTEPMSLVKIEKGIIDSLDFKMTADTSDGEANLALPYRSLKISFLKKKGATYKNKSLFSFFTNIVVRNNNKAGEGMRTTNFSVSHKKRSAFFAFIWSSMLKGIKDISIFKP